MKKTLKRELKLFEIVESDAFVVSVSAFYLRFCLAVRGDSFFPVHAGVSKAGGFASWRQLRLRNCNGGKSPSQTFLCGGQYLWLRGGCQSPPRLQGCSPCRIGGACQSLTSCQFFPYALFCVTDENQRFFNKLFFPHTRVAHRSHRGPHSLRAKNVSI